MLPKYDKSKRRKGFEQLPKGAYVIKILAAREEQNKNSAGRHLAIVFDIAEGEYKGFYENLYKSRINEDKGWSPDGMTCVNIPDDDSPAYVWTNWNSFFSDLEDSNNGFVFSGDVGTLKGKVIGGKFAIEQSEFNGNVYDHTKFKWSCVADDVRNGRPGKMPKDKLLTVNKVETPETPVNAFFSIDPEKDGLPFA